ncbi:Uncharacterised protein [Cedecea neteri]|nr:Uncharacterised protein [Cedecea neteri]
MTDTYHQLTEGLTEYESFLLNALITQEERTLGHVLSSARRRQLAEEAAAHHAQAVKQAKYRKVPRGRPRKIKDIAEPEAVTKDFQWCKSVSSRLLPRE